MQSMIWHCHLPRRVLSTLIVSFFALHPAHGATRYWRNNAGSGNWSDATKWSSVSATDTNAANNGVPAGGDTVRIDNTDGVPHAVDFNAASISLASLTVDLTGAGTATNTLSLSTSNAISAGYVGVGGYNGVGETNGRGTFIQSNGTLSTSSGLDMVIGWGAGSTGNYMLSGTGTVNAFQSIFVGAKGNGTFTQSGGTTNVFSSAVGYLNVGASPGAFGTYNMSGGTLSVAKFEYVGDQGTGAFNQTGGTNTITGAGNGLLLGNTATGVGTYTASGTAALTVPGDVTVGLNGSGTFNVQGNANVNISGALMIGAGDAVNLSGGTLRFDGYTRNATGTFNFTGGTVQLAGNRNMTFNSTVTSLFGASPNISAGKKLVVEGNATIGGSGGTTVTVSGAGSAFNSLGSLKLADSSNQSATLNISNGATASNAGVTVGAYQSGAGIISTGTANVSGSGSTWNTGWMIVGDEGEGHVNITGGASVVSSDVNMGFGDGPSARLNTGLVSGPGSSWSSANDFWVGGLAPATLEIADGARVYVEHKLYVWAKSTITLNGGTIRFDTYQNFDNGYPEVTGKIIFNSGTIQLAGSRTLGFDPILLEHYGKLAVLPAGKGLTVEEVATIPYDSGLTINGGTMCAKNLVVNGPFQFSGGVLEITGGTITGLTSLNIPTGGEFRATGTQDLRIAGAAGSTITATGNLTLGSAAAVNGFYTDGTLTVGSNTVTLSDANDAAFDSGALISLGNGAAPGTLNAANGLTLDFGGNAVGFGTITTLNTVAKPLINNGHITGTSAAQKITLPGYVKGVGTFDNVSFTGTFSPGLSPTALQAGNIDLSNTSTLVMELGGTSPGSGYDQIQSTGTLTFDGTLQVSLINGFTPTAGQSFNLFDWVNQNGTFDTLALPTLAGLSLEHLAALRHRRAESRDHRQASRRLQPRRHRQRRRLHRLAK